MTDLPCLILKQYCCFLCLSLLSSVNGERTFSSIQFSYDKCNLCTQKNQVAQVKKKLIVLGLVG